VHACVAGYIATFRPQLLYTRTSPKLLPPLRRTFGTPLHSDTGVLTYTYGIDIRLRSGGAPNNLRNFFTDRFDKSGCGRAGMGRDRVGRDGMRWDGMGSHGTGCDGTGKDGIRRDGKGWNGAGRTGAGGD
jgi:hypothetical protein